MGKHFLWDPVEDNIVKEIDDSGTTIADYTTEPYLYGDLISQHRTGQSSFYHYDGQGSTTSLTDSAANVTDTYAYSAFGEVTEQAGSTENPFQYLGRKEYYKKYISFEFSVRRRLYNSHQSQWISTDPLLIGLGDIRWLNPYQYASNRPISCCDASGLSAMCDATASVYWVNRDDLARQQRLNTEYQRLLRLWQEEVARLARLGISYRPPPPSPLLDFVQGTVTARIASDVRLCGRDWIELIVDISNWIELLPSGVVRLGGDLRDRIFRAATFLRPHVTQEGTYCRLMNTQVFDANFRRDGQCAADFMRLFFLCRAECERGNIINPHFEEGEDELIGLEDLTCKDSRGKLGLSFRTIGNDLRVAFAPEQFIIDWGVQFTERTPYRVHPGCCSPVRCRAGITIQHAFIPRA